MINERAIKVYHGFCFYYHSNQFDNNCELVLYPHCRSLMIRLKSYCTLSWTQNNQTNNAGEFPRKYDNVCKQIDWAGVRTGGESQVLLNA